MNIYRFEDDLYLVDLPQKLEGFRSFISSWIYIGDYSIVVDPGPKNTVYRLVDSLHKLGIKNVDYILLTHIHIDHAGGVGEFIRYFENAKVLVNEKGREHLINPERLWQGSLKVLGDLAKVYGEIDPLDSTRFVDSIEEVEVIYTPGHAVHHQSYVVGDYLFTGEALGVFQMLKDDIYQRPATPPRFIYEVAEESVEKLKALRKKKVCFGHFGLYEDSTDVARYAEKQLKMWVDEVFDAICCVQNDSFDFVFNEVKNRLMEKDTRFANYEELDSDIKKREDYFIKNSIKGIYEYVKENRT